MNTDSNTNNTNNTNTYMPTYKVSHTADLDRDDFGGRVFITASDMESKLALLQYLRKEDASEIVRILQDPEPYVHIGESKRRDNGAWFLCEDYLGVEWTKPYLDRFAIVTGWNTGTLPDIPAEFLSARYLWGGLCHTHIMRRVALKDGDLHYSFCIESQDWNKMSAGQRAPLYAKECAQKALGDQRREPEYIELFNGFSKRNPDYLKTHAPHPAFKAEWFWEALIDWWLENFATPEQKAAVAADIEVLKSARCGGSIYSMNNYDKGIRRSWETDGLIPWYVFQQLGK